MQNIGTTAGMDLPLSELLFRCSLQPVARSGVVPTLSRARYVCELDSSVPRPCQVFVYTYLSMYELSSSRVRYVCGWKHG